MNQTDKFALGGGGYTLYAPQYPRFQREPGFFDEVLIFDAEVRPLYGLTVLENDVPVKLECTGIKFENGNAVLTYQGRPSLKVTETRFVTTDDRFVSNLKVHHEGKGERELVIVQWTWTDPEGEAPSLEGDSFRIKRSLARGEDPAVPAEIVWSSPDSKGARCLQAFFCLGGSDRPDFEETPWFDMADLPTPRAKRQMLKPSPILPDAKVYLGLFRRIKLKANGSVEHRFEANVIFKGKGINYRPRRPDAKDESGYQAFMEKTPRFVCEDKRLEKLVKHRLESLHLLRVPNGVGHMSTYNVCQGTGEDHIPVAFSAPAILREARWLGDPTVGRGVLRGFFENVRQSGMVPGRLHLTSLSGVDHYHADWGGGFEALDAVHSDRATKRAVLMSMQRYVKWLANNRDPEGSGLTDVVHQFESGQGPSRRFMVIDDKSDRAEEASEQFRLKGVDASLFRYKLVRFLAQVAEELQEKAMCNRFLAEKEVIHDVIRKRLWDDKAGLFMDLDPKTRRRTGVKAAVGFYALGTDIPKPAQVDKLLEALGDRKEFWTKYPVPTVAITDASFNADGHWKGTRTESPWNGRVWPMVNSQILEALAYVAERGNKRAQKLCGDLFERTVSMMSGELEGVAEPRSFEHYHPITGRASRYRATDICLHSFMLDNIFRVGCGFVVRFGEIQDDPVMANMPDFKVTDLPVGNKRFSVERKGAKLKISSQ
ncbi:MAG: trehalase family glycosidase [Planctomycetota bacterium]